MKNITEALNWRYATKKFDPTKKINENDLDNILEALRLSPSSYGLQPWKFILVNNREVREKIRAIGYDQSQITEASQIIIFANKKNIDDNLVDEYIKFVSDEKKVSIEKLQGLTSMMKGSFAGKSADDLRSWAACQLYLSVGVLLTSCAVSGIDACPMEGFDRVKLDELLGLTALNLESKVIVAMGYRSLEDDSAGKTKIRFERKEVFIKID